MILKGKLQGRTFEMTKKIKICILHHCFEFENNNVCKFLEIKSLYLVKNQCESNQTVLRCIHFCYQD